MDAGNFHTTLLPQHMWTPTPPSSTVNCVCRIILQFQGRLLVLTRFWGKRATKQTAARKGIRPSNPPAKSLLPMRHFPLPLWHSGLVSHWVPKPSKCRRKIQRRPKKSENRDTSDRKLTENSFPPMGLSPTPAASSSPLGCGARPTPAGRATGVGCSPPSPHARQQRGGGGPRPLEGSSWTNEVSVCSSLQRNPSDHLKEDGGHDKTKDNMKCKYNRSRLHKGLLSHSELVIVCSCSET